MQLYQQIQAYIWKKRMLTLSFIMYKKTKSNLNVYNYDFQKKFSKKFYSTCAEILKAATRLT